MTTTTATKHTGALSDQLSSRTAEHVLPSPPELRQWRFVSAVQAAWALNARPA